MLTGEDARHLSLSLRAKTGEQITLCDSAGSDYLCRITQISKACVSLAVLEKKPSPGESAVEITLFQALCKGEKMDSIVQKSVELGVCHIQPMLTSRCVARMSAEMFEKKRQRYQKIALEAAKQCGRGKIPDILPLISLSDIPARLGAYQTTLFCYERAAAPLRAALPDRARTLAIITGSEGGFEEEEARALAAAGAVSVSLGSRILRCETAPLAALAACLFAMGEM